DIKIKKNIKKSSKSFDLLTLVYFKDMFYVLKEMKRVMKKNSLAFIIVGDSAPFGIHVPTDIYLGEISLELGFSSYTIQPIRERGTKWTSLKYRHNRKLREVILILRK
ncbi:MAG: methyltransferase, partial [Nanoarchaeota archaeon]|nr:methyltransferase [Nanoarchaeota archaeon]